jgi:prophage regulatory protein
MKLLDYADLRERGIKYSKAQLWRLSKAGKFPKPMKLSINRNAWADTDIDEWIARLIAERDAVEAA